MGWPHRSADGQGRRLPEKARGLKAWPRVEQVFDQTGVYRVRQSSNHVKVVVDRGTTSAKVRRSRTTGSLTNKPATTMPAQPETGRGCKTRASPYQLPA